MISLDTILWGLLTIGIFYLVLFFCIFLIFKGYDYNSKKHVRFISGWHKWSG